MRVPFSSPLFTEQYRPAVITLFCLFDKKELSFYDEIGKSAVVSETHIIFFPLPVENDCFFACFAAKKALTVLPAPFLFS